MSTFKFYLKTGLVIFLSTFLFHFINNSSNINHLYNFTSLIKIIYSCLIITLVTSIFFVPPIKYFVDRFGKISDKNLNSIINLVENEDIESLQKIIDSGIEFDIAIKDSYTPLLYAAQKGKYESLQVLINAGADINFQCTADGMTALHWACLNSDVEMVEVLLENGADPTLKDGYGRTPMVWAKKNQKIIKIFKKYSN